MNYIKDVKRNEVPPKIIATSGSVDIVFAVGRDGKPKEVARKHNGAMVYDRSNLFVPRGTYCQMLRRVYGVAHGLTKQGGPAAAGGRSPEQKEALQ